MFKWIAALFTANEPVKPPTKAPPALTLEEKLRYILFSFKTNKIDIETTVELIYLWRLRRDISH